MIETFTGSPDKVLTDIIPNIEFNEYDIPRPTESIAGGDLILFHMDIPSVIVDGRTRFLDSSLTNEYLPPVSVINHCGILNNIVLNNQVLSPILMARLMSDISMTTCWFLLIHDKSYLHCFINCGSLMRALSSICVCSFYKALTGEICLFDNPEVLDRRAFSSAVFNRSYCFNHLFPIVFTAVNIVWSRITCLTDETRE
jgi:hypothetical protein